MGLALASILKLCRYHPVCLKHFKPRNSGWDKLRPWSLARANGWLRTAPKFSSLEENARDFSAKLVTYVGSIYGKDKNGERKPGAVVITAKDDGEKKKKNETSDRFSTGAFWNPSSYYLRRIRLNELG